MDSKEFNKTAVRTETDREVRFDVRPFRERQGEAIDSYLHDVLAQVQYGTMTPGRRTWVLIHDPSAVVPDTAADSISILAARGFDIQLRRES